MRRPTLGVLVNLTVSLVMLLGGSSPLRAQENSSSEGALRKNVADFYALLRVKKSIEAEKFVTAASLDQFRIMPLGDFIGSEITSVTMAPDNKSALVMINLMVSAATVPVPFQLPRRTDWKLEDGSWKIEIPAQNIQSSGAEVMFPDNSRKPQPPPKMDLEFGNPLYNMPQIKQGDKKSAAYKFVNSTNHPVTISHVETDCACLEWKPSKRTFAPGEAGELTVEFDSSDYQYDYRTTVAVFTEPGNQRTNLHFAVNIIPKP